eukprot:TCONS_00011652-protein
MAEGTSAFEGCAVIFHNVVEWYKPTENVACYFSMKDNVSIDTEEQPHCFVAIFPVGWDNLEANITRKNFTLIEAVSDKSFQIEFLENELPANNPDEFYQFCFYNIKTEVVYGASCPFQICNRSDSEPFIVCSNGSPRSETDRSSKTETSNSMNTWVDENNIEITESEDDFTTVMVTKKAAHLKEDLTKAKLQTEELLRSNESMKTQSKHTVTEINRLNQDIDLGEKKVALLEENVKENEKVINHLNGKMRNMKEELIAEHNAKVAELSKEMEALNSGRAKALLENNIMTSEFKNKEESLLDEIAHLKITLEIEKSSCKLLEDVHKNVLEKFSKIKNEHGKDLEEAKLIQIKLVEVESQIKIEKQKNITLLNDFENLTASHEQLKTLAEKKEAEFQEIKNSLREELALMTTQMQEHIDKLSNELAESKQKEQELEQINNESQERMKELEPQIEEICRLKAEEIERLNDEIKRQADLLHESNSQLHNIQLQMDEKTNQMLELEMNFKEKEEQTELIMEDLRSKVEELQENQIEETKSKSPKPSTMTKSEGSYYALQVAYNFIQKQLKQFKAENEELRKMNHMNLPSDIKDVGVSDNPDAVVKENSELKLRLQFGKKAFETQFKENSKLKSELKTLKRSTSTKDSAESFNKFEFVDVKEKKEALELELTVVKGQLATKEKNEEELVTQLQDRNDRVRQFEDKYKLAKIENDILKHQVSALLEGGATATIRRKFDPTVPHKTEAKKPEIAYPPSMVRIEREKREHARWLPSKTPQEPPSIQMIPNRELPQPSAPTISQVATNVGHQPVVPANGLIGRGRGRGAGQHHGYQRDGCVSTSPISICPVCEHRFPEGFSELAASNHVNEHFTDQ